MSVPGGDGKEFVAKQSPPHEQEAEGIPKEFPLGLTS